MFPLFYYHEFGFAVALTCAGQVQLLFKHLFKTTRRCLCLFVNEYSLQHTKCKSWLMGSGSNAICFLFIWMRRRSLTQILKVTSSCCKSLVWRKHVGLLGIKPTFLKHQKEELCWRTSHFIYCVVDQVRDISRCQTTWNRPSAPTGYHQETLQMDRRTSVSSIKEC